MAIAISISMEHVDLRTQFQWQWQWSMWKNVILLCGSKYVELEDVRLCENAGIVMMREPILSIDIFPSEKGKTERGVLAFIIYFQLVI